MYSIVIIKGTVRHDNFTRYVADFVNDAISKRTDIQTTLLDPAQLNLSFSDEGETAKSVELQHIIDTADGFIIVAPEYNHGYPGSLKYLLDLNYKEYLHKPVGFVSVSKNVWGGVRMIENLLPVVRTLGLVALQKDVQIPLVRELFKDGRCTDPETLNRRIDKLLNELMWMTETLKQGRERA